MEKEETPTGVVEEQPKEEISTVVSEPASKEEKATSAKDDEWKRMMQSRADKAEHEAKIAHEKLQKLEQEREQQRLASRKKEIEALEGEPEEQAKLRRKHELEDEVTKLEQLKSQQEGAVERKYDQALELASKYNLGLAEARELMNAETPREMELLAQLKVKDLEIKEPPKESVIPDSGKTDAGGEDDETFMINYSEGKSDDHARAQKILAKLK